MDAGRVCPPWPDSPSTCLGSGCARGEVVVMRMSEFIRLLIVMLLLGIILIAVSR